MYDVKRIKVWDPLVRIFHWSLVGAFSVAYLSGEGDEWLGVHSRAGYTVLGLVLVRLLWGFVGTPHARFSDFVQRPAVVVGYLKQVFTLRAPRYLGHNPAGGAMIVLLLVSLLLTTLFGLATYGAAEGAGPLAGLLAGTTKAQAHALEEVHEFCANFTLLLVGLHLAGVVVESLLHRENLVAAMFSGNKRAEG